MKLFFRSGRIRGGPRGGCGDFKFAQKPALAPYLGHAENETTLLPLCSYRLDVGCGRMLFFGRTLCVARNRLCRFLPVR